jgi:hypothetical protein
VRLADIIFRGGHLSEQALIEAVMTGERPVHLERCDICAERAVHLGRWLDEVRATGIEAGDVAFPPERLLAQQQQIMRRLEQLDQPARVIAFPSQYTLAREMGGRRVAAGWLGVAAAAGVILGAVGAQTAVRYGNPGSAAPVAQVQPTGATAISEPQPHETPLTAPAATMLDENIERVRISALDALDSMTPTLVLARNGG